VCPVTVDGQHLLASAGYDGAVRIWDPATGQQRAILEGHQAGVTAVCPVTVDGQHLLASAGDDGTVRIWNPAAGQVQALVRVDGPLLACAQIGVAGLASGGKAGLYGFDYLPMQSPDPSRAGNAHR
jgi:WD40 repeat protein